MDFGVLQGDAAVYVGYKTGAYPKLQYYKNVLKAK